MGKIYFKRFILLIIFFGLMNCNDQSKTEYPVIKPVQYLPKDLKAMATEGISVKFIFKNNKPVYGDLLLMTGNESKEFPSRNKEFHALKSLGLIEIDNAYFGIENEPGNRNNVLGFLLIPVKHDNIFFDSILLDYVPLRCESKRAELVKEIITQFHELLDVQIVFENEDVIDVETLVSKIDKIIEYCNEELKLEPGSEKAIALLEKNAL